MTRPIDQLVADEGLVDDLGCVMADLRGHPGRTIADYIASTYTNPLERRAIRRREKRFKANSAATEPSAQVLGPLWSDPVRGPYDRAEPLVYFFQVVTGEIKIGISNDVERRLDDVRALNGGAVELLLVLRGGETLESALHYRFKRLHLHHEWFKPATELLAWLQEVKELPRVGGDTHL